MFANLFRRKKSAPKARTCFRPTLEVLEDRITPTGAYYWTGAVSTDFMDVHNWTVEGSTGNLYFLSSSNHSIIREPNLSGNFQGVLGSPNSAAPYTLRDDGFFNGHTFTIDGTLTCPFTGPNSGGWSHNAGTWKVTNTNWIESGSGSSWSGGDFTTNNPTTSAKFYVNADFTVYTPGPTAPNPGLLQLNTFIGSDHNGNVVNAIFNVGDPSGAYPTSFTLDKLAYIETMRQTGVNSDTRGVLEITVSAATIFTTPGSSTSAILNNGLLKVDSGLDGDGDNLTHEIDCRIDQSNGNGIYGTTAPTIRIGYNTTVIINDYSTNPNGTIEVDGGYLIIVADIVPVLPGDYSGILKVYNGVGVSSPPIGKINVGARSAFVGTDQSYLIFASPEFDGVTPTADYAHHIYCSFSVGQSTAAAGAVNVWTGTTSASTYTHSSFYDGVRLGLSTLNHETDIQGNFFGTCGANSPVNYKMGIYGPDDTRYDYIWGLGTTSSFISVVSITGTTLTVNVGGGNIQGNYNQGNPPSYWWLLFSGDQDGNSDYSISFGSYAWTGNTAGINSALIYLDSVPGGGLTGKLGFNT